MRKGERDLKLRSPKEAETLFGITPDISCLYKFRVSYSDTDQMGFMHHSSYFKYYETARWELFRSCGVPYDVIENEGIILPVVNAAIDYKKAALYDQVITIGVRLKYYRGARFIFYNTMTNEDNEMINQAEITIACVNKDRKIACLPFGKLQQFISTLKTDSKG